GAVSTPWRSAPIAANRHGRNPLFLLWLCRRFLRRPRLLLGRRLFLFLLLVSGLAHLLGFLLGRGGLLFRCWCRRLRRLGGLLLRLRSPLAPAPTFRGLLLGLFVGFSPRAPLLALAF